ncbi:MAG: DNA recombination protein RmuC [Pseudomonadota bacterium]|nr:DNA recombination protein RmuC [Pseudomonadota bacterium]
MIVDPAAVPWELFIVAVGLFVLGAGISALYYRDRLERQRADDGTEIVNLTARLEIERQRHREKVAAMEEARKHMMATFASLSRRALHENSEAFLSLAQQNLQQFHVKAQAGLDEKEKAVGALVAPIREALDKTRNQVHEIEKERKEAYGALNQHLRLVAESHRGLQTETRNLVKALSRPEVRGRWGEMTLKRLAELSGMVEHCDFFEQESVRSEQGMLRPDMVVRMPDKREIVVDAKTPLDGYLEAMEATDDEQRARALKRHARKLRDRVKELAGKAYWTQFRNSPDFVVLFIPGDQFLAAALELDPDILEDSLDNKVVLATPTSLVALLRAVAFGWRQLVLTRNAEIIRDLGEDLYRRIATFVEHMSRLGRNLGSSVENYNRALGSLERQVLPGARKFTELGIQPKKDMENLEPIEKTTLSPKERDD